MNVGPAADRVRMNVGRRSGARMKRHPAGRPARAKNPAMHLASAARASHGASDLGQGPDI
jgi:hypothetical protein